MSRVDKSGFEDIDHQHLVESADYVSWIYTNENSSSTASNGATMFGCCVTFRLDQKDEAHLDEARDYFACLFTEEELPKDSQPISDGLTDKDIDQMDDVMLHISKKLKEALPHARIEERTRHERWVHLDGKIFRVLIYKQE